MLVNNPSKLELLSWINQLAKVPFCSTQTNIQKLQELSDGVIFCQLFEKIYPGNINLQKLKRDAKNTQYKVKNFKMLQIAVENLKLSVSFNINDLAAGKVTSILNLLQWMFKESKHPSIQHARSQVKSIVNEPRVIKSYVGNLVQRQHSLQKEIGHSADRRNTIEKPTESRGQGRKSLDLRGANNQDTNQDTHQDVEDQSDIKTIKAPSKKKSEKKSEKESQRRSEHSVLKSQKQRPKSSVRKVHFNQQDFQAICSIKKQELSELKENKKAKRPQTISQALHQTFDYDQQKLRKKLILVTQEVLHSNPELESKLKRLLGEQENGENVEKGKNSSMKLNQPRSQRKVIISSMNTSLNCEDDSVQDIQVDNYNSAIKQKSEKKQNCEEINEKNDQTIMYPSLDQNNLVNQSIQKQKKDTVKKSMAKEFVPQSYSQMPSSSNLFKNISAQKEKPQMVLNGQNDQNNQMNQNSMMKRQNLIQNKQQHSFVPFKKNSNNPEMFFTEKKPETKPDFTFGKSKTRPYQSERYEHGEERQHNNFVRQNLFTGGCFPMSQVHETQRECYQSSESSNPTVQLDKSQEPTQKFE